MKARARQRVRERRLAGWRRYAPQRAPSEPRQSNNSSNAIAGPSGIAQCDSRRAAPCSQRCAGKSRRSTTNPRHRAWQSAQTRAGVNANSMSGPQFLAFTRGSRVVPADQALELKSHCGSSPVPGNLPCSLSLHPTWILVRLRTQQPISNMQKAPLHSLRRVLACRANAMVSRAEVAHCNMSLGPHEFCPHAKE